MSWPKIPAKDLMLRRGGSINPAKFPEETFELLSIPACDKEQPEILKGNEIGSSKSCVQPDDVLLSKIVPHIRRCWIVPSPSGNYRQIGSGEWIIFRSDKIYSPYLKHFLTSDVFHKQFMNTTAGVGGSLVRARPAEVERIEIPLPPLPEQKRIAAILDKADAIRRKRQQAIQLADEFLRSVFLDMFGDPVMNPKRWDVRPLIELIDPDRPITYGILKPGDDVDEGVPYIRVVDMKDGVVLSDQVRRTTHEIALQYKRSTLRPGDILLSIRGHVGRLAVVPDVLNGSNITQDTARLATNELCRPLYLYACLDTRSMQFEMQRYVKGAAVKGINLMDVKQLSIPVPPIEMQEKIEGKIRVMTEIIRKFEISNTGLSAEFNSLVQNAFYGNM